MTDEELKKLSILKKLVNEYGDDLIEEIAYIVEENGQGDCYACLCDKYCDGLSCFNAIKKVVKDILGIEEDKQ